MDYPGPGRTGELTGQLLANWQSTVSAMFETGRQVAEFEASGQAAGSWFFNQVVEQIDDIAVADIAWTAFPKRLSGGANPIVGWREGDRRRSAQEEYCEWVVIHDPANPSIVRKVVFTTETPDYYDFLSRSDRGLLLAIYREHVSPEVEFDDLLLGGRYSDFNQWNHPGQNGVDGTIMHMGGNRANTLGAAINLSAQATWPSVDQAGAPITGEQELIACRGFGDSVRHSDPFIGAQINQLARAGKKISFAGPVGLYIDSIDFSDFEIPDGIGVPDIFSITRGDEDFMMRVEFEMPPGSGLSLSDVEIGGEPIAFGSQIAEKMRIRVRGIAADVQEQAPSIRCDSGFRGFSAVTQSRGA